MLRNFIISALFVSTASIVSAQQKTGNIVEYFGKDRIEKVDEGTVTYRFSDGFYVPQTTENGYLFPTGDQMAWEFFSNNFKNPYSGDLQAVNYGRTRENVQWTPIEIDSTGKFKKRELRRAYLYSEYTSPKEEIVLLQATGGTRTLINGMPHEGDHYDFAYTLIPFKAKKGANQVVFTPGRFGYVEASIIKPEKPIMFTKRDMTLADIITGEDNEKWAAIRVVNASEAPLKGMTIKCTLESGESATYATEDIMDMTVRKLAFKVPAVKNNKEGKVKATLTLADKSGKTLDTTEIELEQRSGDKVHERTFRSRVDGSVQYYSVNPSTTKGDGQALFLSVHGASVEARNQSRAYAPKDWGYIIAATNRRPYGFNWEEWGRIDAMEVFEEAQKVFKTAPEKSYLTGHSMGGHGTWFLGVTYPDKFAAIAPCASYPDIAGYSRPKADEMNEPYEQYSMIKRAANAGRTLELKRNYLQSGVYVHHGDADNVVPVEQVRRMRRELAEFHPNFCYYEYPGGSHWFSNESVDWKPIFEFFNRQTVPAKKDVKHIEFFTASPAISASNYWATISQQEHSYDFSNIVLDVNADSVKGTTSNVSALTLDFDNMPISGNVIVELDGSVVKVDGKGSVTLRKADGKWSVGNVPATEKTAARSGGFKQAYDNNVVLVYSTKGAKDENEWYKNKARFDAETFLYRGNGSMDVISDKEFLAGDFANRNVVLYGNAKTNLAWASLLSNSPIQVNPTEVVMGNKKFSGDDIGVYFVYPRKDSEKNYVGVVAGTGLKGAKATYPNDYISGISGYPDVMIFSLDYLKDGIRGVKAAGFFGNDWSVDKGDIVISE